MSLHPHSLAHQSLYILCHKSCFSFTPVHNNTCHHKASFRWNWTTPRVDHKKSTSHYSFNHFLYDELDIILDVAIAVVTDNTEAVGEDPHLHGPVSATGEDVIGRSHLNLHDTSSQVPEQRLASMFVREGVEWTLRGQVPNLKNPGKIQKETLLLRNLRISDIQYFSSSTNSMKTPKPEKNCLCSLFLLKKKKKNV